MKIRDDDISEIYETNASKLLNDTKLKCGNKLDCCNHSDYQNCNCLRDSTLRTLSPPAWN